MRYLLLEFEDFINNIQNAYFINIDSLKDDICTLDGINWKNIYDYDDNFKFLDKDEDIDMLSLGDDNLSSTAINLESIMTEDIMKFCHMMN
ncbi:hypothetical protein C1645_832015 [Glomus cerebriforme]|uniref:Uncharacterized protein n=1 Tax=Glomus cerebriforme TaxID=658196 RepID=A0A397SEF3_9GLOM|nr:hypothetical protein C1645_832015 [Glomus cerebriforme]